MSNIEKIRQEIERLKIDYLNRSYTFVPATMEQLLDFIDSLPEEKPSEDLEEEIEMEWDSFNKHIAEYGEESEDVVWLNLFSFRDIARHFAEWGAKHLK